MSFQSHASAAVSSFSFRQFLFIGFDLYSLSLDFEAKPAESADVEIRDPHERKPCDQPPGQTGPHHPEVGQDQKEERDVMTEAILAGEDIKEPANDSRTVEGTLSAPLPRPAQNLLVGHSPRYAGDRDRQHQQFDNFLRQFGRALPFN
jgi:hypothetical protein